MKKIENNKKRSIWILSELGISVVVPLTNYLICPAFYCISYLASNEHIYKKYLLHRSTTWSDYVVTFFLYHDLDTRYFITKQVFEKSSILLKKLGKPFVGDTINLRGRGCLVLKVNITFFFRK